MKTDIEFQDEQSGHETEKKKDTFKEFLDGRILLRSFVVKQLPFVMFIALLAIVYIGNRYHVEKLVRRTSALQTELNELRAEAITVSA